MDLKDDRVFPYDYVYFKASGIIYPYILSPRLFPYDYVYFKAPVYGVLICYSFILFPYDYVYFKASEHSTTSSGSKHYFHTITSILKQNFGLKRLNRRASFPYDYVYFKALMGDLVEVASKKISIRLRLF